MTELAMNPPLVLEFASKRSKRKGPDNTSYDQNKKGKTPHDPGDPGRRKLLIGGAGLLALLGIAKVVQGISEPRTESQQNPVEDDQYQWEALRDSSLPKDKLVKIAENLTQSQIPGFPEVGQVILQSQNKPDSLKTVLPMADTAKPIGVTFRNTVQQYQDLAAFVPETDGRFIKYEIRDKNTQVISSELFTEVSRIAFGIEIDNSFSSAPNIVKQLLLVKEFSHLLYLVQLKDLVNKEVLDKYEFLPPAPADLSTFLLLSGFFKQEYPEIPSLGDSFNYAQFDLDGAGYWHTTPAFGKIKSLGLLNVQDLKVLGSNDLAFKEALRRGLLIGQNGDYQWKEGIGPFSPEWTKIMRAIRSGKDPSKLP